MKLIRITTVPVSLKILLKGQLRFMSKNGFTVTGIASPGTELEEVADTEGIKVFPLSMSREITPLKDLKACWSLWRFLKKEKPQIVHTHTPKAGVVGMLAARLAGVPHRLHTVAGMPLMEATGAKRKLLDFVEKLTYHCATKVYPNSRRLYDFILKNNDTSSQKLKVIAEGSSNGVNTDLFSPTHFSDEFKRLLRESLGISESDFVFIFVGRLVGDKGINELVTAFSHLTYNISSLKLLLVGRMEKAFILLLLLFQISELRH